jgi:hypothetical protein
MILRRVKLALIVVLILGAARLVSEAAPPAAAPTAKAPRAQPNPANALKETVHYPGVEDARATLNDALDQLTKLYNLTFDINEKAFEMDQLKDVARTPVADPTPIPPMHTTLTTVLRKILRRVPAESGTTYLIRRDHIEITTGNAVRSELGIPEDRPLLPLVWETFKETPLVETLPCLAEGSGYNVAADPHTGALLQTKITVQLNNVPIGTAVRLLASMAGLSVVRLDNVFFVTTAEKADGLREEQERMEGVGPELRQPTPAKPAK